MNRDEYYTKDEVIFEIVKCLVGRETAILTKGEEGKGHYVRCIKAHKVEFLKRNFDVFQFYKYPYNLYYSLARYNNMPFFSFSIKKRLPEQESFNQNFRKFMTGYDIGLDFDNHTHTKEGQEQAYNDCKTIKNELDSYKVPYELKASGSGFHININDWVLAGVNDKVQHMMLFTTMIKTIFNLKSLDDSITDARRIWKTPYSYDVTSGNIALPLTDEQFENFNEQLIKPETVLEMNLRNRGLIERKGSVRGYQDFLKDYIEGE